MTVGRVRRVGIAVALGAWLALGCGSDEAEQPAAAPQSPVAVIDPGAADSGRSDSQGLPDFDSLPTIELPANFPIDVPLYPGARAVKANPDQWSPTSWVAQFSTPDEPAKVSVALVDALAAQGWTTESVTASDGIMVYANKDQRAATYALSTAKGKTVMTLVLIDNETP